jgi:aminopeptidase N
MVRRGIGLIGMILCLTCAARRAGAQGASHAFANPDLWRWAPSRTYHVENYKLTLHFDEPRGEVFGDEVVTLRPFEPHFRRFYLNSSGLKIDSVALVPARGAEVKLRYAAKDPRLWITLDREYDAANTLRVRIVYHGFPRTGLFFVNPTKEYPKWPREVFSQGEPEFNHFWFPCWDYPNDMATSETITTVPDGQSVVSNGKLVKVTRAKDEKTYDWVESVPHSSYLTSIAVGPWRKIADSYDGKPVDYYVANSVDEATARRSFHLTPDMIRFFSQATGVNYPYEKYAQTAVHNYIFGGQENVSATTVTDFTLHDARADTDYPSTGVVSHELGQQWFGDYVQARDWADIWLNEGFATYMEALYTQHHEGYDAYRFAMYQDQMGEQEEERAKYRRPIVDRHYDDPLDMFDATTHEKGAAVLDMLRYLVDGAAAAAHPASQRETLFRALHDYLTTRHAQTADTDDLLDTIRKSTGLELGWFFREWVFMAGHPEYRVEASYDKTARIEKVKVEQIQRVDAMTPVFDMPVELAFHGPGGEQKEVQVRDHLRRQEFDVPLDFRPLWVDFDPDDIIDKTLRFKQPLAALIAEAENDPAMMSRLGAVQQLGMAAQGRKGEEAAACVKALAHVIGTDAFYGVRAAAATSLGRIPTEGAREALLAAMKQPNSRVRTKAAESLGKFSKDKAVYKALVNALHNDASYAVEAAAARAIGRSGAADAFDVLRAEAAARPEVDVMQATLGGLAETKDPRAAAILLAQAQPGIPERIRLSALAGLAALEERVEREQEPELVATVRAAMDDPFLPVRMAGEQLVAVFGLRRFRSDVQAHLNSPLIMQRELAKQVLEKLRPSGK